MRIITKEIRQGQWDGTYIWVCQFNQPDLNKKPLRKVPPTKVYVCSNEEHQPKKTIYYSRSHLRKVNKNGEPLKSGIMSPVDNTGFRSNPGKEIDAFDNEQECVEEWNRQVIDVLNRIDGLYARVDNQLKETIDLLAGSLEGIDISKYSGRLRG